MDEKCLFYDALDAANTDVSSQCLIAAKKIDKKANSQRIFSKKHTYKSEEQLTKMIQKYSKSV